MRSSQFAIPLTVALMFAAASVPAAAQQTLPPVQQKAPAKPSKPATPAASETAPKAGGDNPLRSRVEQLEEQLVDLQVTIGTLESLARTTASAPASSGRAPAAYSGGGDQSGVSARVDGLEIQLRALVGQVEQLADQVRTLNNRRAGNAPGPAPAPEPRTAGTSGFGSTVVTPGNQDQIGQVIADETTRPQPAAAAGTGDLGNPKQLYESAYAYLLQQNYGAAETAFEEFLGRYPSDSLAGNAQYWLGESHFVRGQYKQAAGAFLKGYQSYGRSAKAPDSLLKLAMSLDRLGQRDAACSSYGELNTRFPAAPQTIKARADSERRRIGCP